MITQYLQQILSYHVKFKVCQVSKLLARGESSNFKLKRGVFFRLFSKCMIKHLLNLVLARYHELSNLMSIICLSLQQITQTTVMITHYRAQPPPITAYNQSGQFNCIVQVLEYPFSNGDHCTVRPCTVLVFLQEVQVSGDFIVTTEGFQDVKSVSALNIADACRLQDSCPL